MLQVATLQTRLERMGRMEASMAAARRTRSDDATSVMQRRLTSIALAVGATSVGGLGAWIILSRMQQSKA